MRKNRMMRLASVLLILTMVTTCAISGTFAKYTTSDSGTDTARVAKWGVTVEAKNLGSAEGGLFSKEYSSGVGTTVSSGEKVLAPGTDGDFAEIKITGIPEVMVDVSIDATVDLGDGWKVGEAFYCPVIITVGSGTDEQTFDGLNYENATDLETAVATAIETKQNGANGSNRYNPGTDLASYFDGAALDISWEWPFNERNGGVYNQTDANDTILGNAGTAGMTIAVDIRVDQVD